MSRVDWKEVIRDRKRLVVKIGSAVLASRNGLDETIIIQIADQISRLREQGHEVTIVSSGAIAAGILRLSGSIRPRTIPEKQALAAVGQGRLMHFYERAFSRFGITVAQVLLTRDGLVPRRRYVNAKNTLKTLLKWGIIPIVNENDTVATDEIQFTDNDALAVLVVHLTESNMFICLSDIDGLYSKDPRIHPDAQPVPVVSGVSAKVLAMAGPDPGRAGRGGMRSKLLAARLVTASGVPMVVAKGRRPDCLLDIMRGRSIGTLFLPQKRPHLHGKKPWIACTLHPEGVLHLDKGAARALRLQGSSLLPVGITGVEGEFEQGACILCKDPAGKDVATGITNWSSRALKGILGLRSDQISDRLGTDQAEEVIHRDNMVVWGGDDE